MCPGKRRKPSNPKGNYRKFGKGGEIPRNASNDIESKLFQAIELTERSDLVYFEITNRAKFSSFEKLSLKTYGDCRLKLYMRDIVTPGHVT